MWILRKLFIILKKTAFFWFHITLLVFNCVSMFNGVTVRFSWLQSPFLEGSLPLWGVSAFAEVRWKTSFISYFPNIYYFTFILNSFCLVFFSKWWLFKNDLLRKNNLFDSFPSALFLMTNVFSYLNT